MNWLGFGMGLMLLLPGCNDQPARRAEGRPYAAQGDTTTETPTIENAEERAEEVRRVCSRKAGTGIEISRCWTAHVEKTGNRKFEGDIQLMLIVSPEGKAEEVRVLNPTAQLNDLEKCVADAAQGWSYPSGQNAAPVQCSFHLKPF